MNMSNFMELELLWHSFMRNFISNVHKNYVNLIIFRGKTSEDLKMARRCWRMPKDALASGSWEKPRGRGGWMSLKFQLFFRKFYFSTFYRD